MEDKKVGRFIVDLARQGEAYPDASGFRQNHPDANGFAPGKVSKDPDGTWHSNYPDAHGCFYSSTK
jgi:hypothetical protein